MADPSANPASESENEPIRFARCPLCGKMTEQRFRPFCSKRCADLDLSRWLNGVYAVPVPDNADEDREV